MVAFCLTNTVSDYETDILTSSNLTHIVCLMKERLQFPKKLRCGVGGKVKHENLVSNELITIKLPSKKHSEPIRIPSNCL